MSSRSSTQAEQLRFNWELPTDERMKKQRIRKIRKHLFGLVESIPEKHQVLSPGRVRKVKAFIKTLLKDSQTNWDGTGTFRQSWLANDCLVSSQTVGNWMKWGKELGVIEWSVSTDHKGIPRTTVQLLWRAIAALSKQVFILDDQSQTSSADQTKTVDDQTKTVTRPNSNGLGRSSSCPSKSPSPPPSHSAGWEGVEAELSSILRLWQQAIGAAKANGLTPSQVGELIEHYRCCGGMYDEGALFGRLQNAHPTQQSANGWPRPKAPSSRVKDALKCLEAARKYDRRPPSEDEFVPWFFGQATGRHRLEACDVQEALMREQLGEAVAR